MRNTSTFLLSNIQIFLRSAFKNSFLILTFSDFYIQIKKLWCSINFLHISKCKITFPIQLEGFLKLCLINHSACPLSAREAAITTNKPYLLWGIRFCGSHVRGLNPYKRPEGSLRILNQGGGQMAHRRKFAVSAIFLVRVSA